MTTTTTTHDTQCCECHDCPPRPDSDICYGCRAELEQWDDHPPAVTSGAILAVMLERIARIAAESRELALDRVLYQRMLDAGL